MEVGKEPTYGPAAGQITLTFPGDVSTNPDLQYFKAGDVVQSDEDGWNNDIVWSGLVNSPDGYYLDNDATKAFDGDKNTSCSAP